MMAGVPSTTRRRWVTLWGMAWTVSGCARRRTVHALDEVIHEHEEFADQSYIAASIVGVLTLVALVRYSGALSCSSQLLRLWYRIVDRRLRLRRARARSRT